MKTIITTIAAVAALTAGAFAAPVVVAADEQTVTLDVTGLKWAAGCPKKVQAALKSVKGVTKVTVGKKVGTNAKTVVTAGKSVQVKVLIKALKKAGFGSSEKKAANEQTVTLDVSGLRWVSGCPPKVQAALKSVKGVTKVTIGKKVGTNAKTVVTAGKSVQVKALIKALKKAGFGATEKKEAKKAA